MSRLMGHVAAGLILVAACIWVVNWSGHIGEASQLDCEYLACVL